MKKNDFITPPNLTLPNWRKKACDWLTWIHLTFMVFTLVSFIFSDSPWRLRWNLEAHINGLTWLTGVLAFLVGIRLKKSALHKWYLRICFIVMIVPSPLYLIVYLSQRIYFTTSENYTISTRRGFLVASGYYLARTNGIIEREICSIEPYEGYEPDMCYSLIEMPDIGAVVFSTTCGDSLAIVNIVTLDTLKYASQTSRVNRLIDGCFNKISGKKAYELYCMYPDTKWKLELTQDDASICSPDSLNAVNKAFTYHYRYSLWKNTYNDTVEAVVERKINPLKDKFNYRDFVFYSVSMIPKDSLPKLTQRTIIPYIEAVCGARFYPYTTNSRNKH